MRRSPAQPLRWLLVSASLLSLGCDGSQSPDNPLSTPGNPASDTSTTAPVTNESSQLEADGPTTFLPLLGLRDRWTLREAHAALVAECMQAAGFNGYKFDPTPFPEDRVAEATPGLELRIAVPDQTSFGLTEAHGRPADGPPPDDYYHSLSPEAQERYADALFGSGAVDVAEVGESRVTRPSAGCLTSAELQLYPDDEYFELDSQRAVLMAEIGPTVLSNLDFQALLVEYEICMRDSGFDAGAPWHAWDLVSRRLDETGAGPNASAYEEQVALADRDCQREVDYSSRATSVHAHVLQSIVERTNGLERLLQIEQVALERATRVLADDRTS